MSQNDGLQNISKMMTIKANELDEMLTNEIPEAFPILPTSGGSDGNWGQCHDQAEYFGARHKTELEDSHRAYDVLTKLLRENISLQLLVGSLYPVEFQGPSHEIKIRDQFTKIKEWLDDAKTVIEQCQKIILMGIDPGIKPVTNRGKIRQLKNHIIRIGWEYVNKGKIPLHLSAEMTKPITRHIDQQVDEQIRNALRPKEDE